MLHTVIQVLPLSDRGSLTRWPKDLSMYLCMRVVIGAPRALSVADSTVYDAMKIFFRVKYSQQKGRKGKSASDCKVLPVLRPGQSS